MRRLHNTLRSLALCAAIGVAVLTWRISVAPPHVLTDAHGQPVLYKGKPVVQQRAFWAQLALLVISSLIQYALAPKPPKPKPASLEDFDIPQTEAGAPFAMFFGENLDESAVVAWYGSLSSKPIKAKGGKK